MAKYCAFVCVLFVLFSNSSGHKLSYGECPNVPPMQGFDMRKMVGLWYVIEKTKTSSSCGTYNFTRTDTPGSYTLQQKYQSMFGQGETTGVLYGQDPRYPASFTVEFPMSIGGSASYIIFATNYEDYAGIFTCQKMLFAHRHSVSILSRRPFMPASTIEKLHHMLLRRHVDPGYLSTISQENCPNHPFNPKEDIIEFMPGELASAQFGRYSRKTASDPEAVPY